MNTNQKLIQTFYTCFQKKDYHGMQECYADNAIFNDSVFVNLNSKQVKAMWQMLISGGKDLRVEFRDIKADERSGTVHWDAYYTFSKTGKKVINRIDSNFKFENGKIVLQTEVFNFYNWSKQAFGIPGLLFGWTPFLKNKIKVQAMKNLEEFMLKNNL